jgi:hypothetical protein
MGKDERFDVKTVTKYRTVTLAADRRAIRLDIT